MGVTGLWQIVQPCARPIKIETLNRKRLAVDASIWIYQFLKAVRDKEGNALRNSHVVGFFRRICKLLFFGIKPVFVFDGGAPALKRQTIRARKARREGRREDAVRTAGKLLAVQMQRRAEEEEAQRRADRDRRQEQEQEETIPDEGLVYVDELQMTQQERQQNRKFRKKDQYHLPDLDVSMSEMGGPNDPRVMSLEELQAYAKQFDTGEDINVYDFSKIDYDSQFFMSLPASDRYNILNAARLRSRLRMGHSKEQLDSMFPDRMAFSKFQIERVRERNELTQRLMHLNGFETMEFGAGRIAGEKGREYILVKNDGVEGGWALGVISDEGKPEQPIDVDRPATTSKNQAEDAWEDEEEDEFEDVPIEGLNRLPKQKSRNEQVSDDLLRQRRAVYDSRRSAAKRKIKRKVAKDPESLFVQSSAEEDEEWEAAGEDDNLFGEGEEDEDEDLRKAIAMSMEKDHEPQFSPAISAEEDGEEDDMLEVFQQKAVAEQRPVPKGSGRDIASIVNKRAFNAAPESREVTSFGVPTLKLNESDEEDGMDLQAALAESRRNKRRTSPSRRPPSPAKAANSATDIAKKAGFQGPLPFEQLDLGSSLLGKRKMQERAEEAAGGFENPELAHKQKKKAEPLPPWFSGDLERDMQAQEALEAEDRQRAREFNQQFHFQERGDMLRRTNIDEVIDLEADDFGNSSKAGEVFDLQTYDPQVTRDKVDPALHRATKLGDVADEIRAEPEIANNQASPSHSAPEGSGASRDFHDADQSFEENELPESIEDVEEEIEWSESDAEQTPLPVSGGDAEVSTAKPPTRTKITPYVNVPVPGNIEMVESMTTARSPSAESEILEFEDVVTSDAVPPQASTADAEQEQPMTLDNHDVSGLVDQEPVPEDDEFDDFSDPEEAEMLRALTLEAEEHARFASSLNNKSQAQNIQEYERELKQLRNQQKKDRRDADEVTQIMIQECQALLRLFGLPYITAPMEAEAQCAELVRLGLVDGIVTDDSDCFLFGGTRIYKNMFNQAKFVECYLTSDLEKEFALTRDKLISVAHLLGSDYTEGLPGIGPVTAIEIVSEFQTLEDFKNWWNAVQMNQIPKTEDAKNAFRKKFRKNSTKLFLPPSFPDQRVGLAYQNPEVDSDAQAFQWGVPDLGALRSFLMSTIGWSEERTDEVLVPVIRDMNRRTDEGTQANITHFFEGTVGIGAAGASAARVGGGEGFAPRKKVGGSKRMGSALSKMAERAKAKLASSDPDATTTQTRVGNDANDESRSVGRTSRKRKAIKKTTAQRPASSGTESDFEESQKRSKKRAKPRKAAGKNKMTSEDDE